MKHLEALLRDVLAGRRLVTDLSTFALLRRYAPHETERLNELEAAAVARKAAETTQPGPVDPSTLPSMAAPLDLTRADLEDILATQRPATLEEIDWLLAHASDRKLRLSSTEELQLRKIATRLLAGDHRAGRVDGEAFIAQVLGTFRTPFGDLSRDEVTRLESIRVRAVHSIQECDEHRKEHCRCWADARTQLSELRSAGDQTPLGASALAIWNSIERLARNRRLDNLSTEQTEGPPGIMYNWRYYKTPSNQ